jgi:hypothetical protein
LSFLFENYYYLILGLQGFCVFHSVKRGTQSKWIWLIVFLPLIGAAIYIYTEILSKKDLGKVQVNLGGIINPGGRIKDLEKKLEFSDTFDNRVTLANALMLSGAIDRAIALYESALVGVFSDNEYVLARLVVAYYEKERFADVIRTADKIKSDPDFRKTHAHVLYAMTLEQTGNLAQAESEFKTMQGRFSNFEARFRYGEFLSRGNRLEEAKDIFEEILKEAGHMSSGEKRNDQVWIAKSQEALGKLKKS